MLMHTGIIKKYFVNIYYKNIKTLAKKKIIVFSPNIERIIHIEKGVYTYEHYNE